MQNRLFTREQEERIRMLARYEMAPIELEIVEKLPDYAQILRNMEDARFWYDCKLTTRATDNTWLWQSTRLWSRCSRIGRS